ncbi:unnamed protein product [Thelazia callipaeda]|uniref:PRORP domain-containing protein n=1 Tax=Thelazia callipaeda TaxID=103827 RepID=A0A0N5CU21_THECL|nr:unnamed protein product [Thelazia callipaeda]
MSNATAGLKASRERCYQSRDEYFQCWDKYNNAEDSKCKKLREIFVKNCPTSWNSGLDRVSHFIRKHKYEKYKQKLIDEGILVTDIDNLTVSRNRMCLSPYRVLLRPVSSCSIHSSSNQSPSKGLQFPKTNIDKLAQCGCVNDVLVDVSVEELCERMKVFGVIKYLGTLRTLKDVRYLKTCRLLLKHLCTASRSLPPYLVLEMAEVLVHIYMEGNVEALDEELRHKLSYYTNTVPPFLRPTILLLLQSCSPVNIVPELPSNIMSRPLVTFALLGNYARYGKMDLFQSLLSIETHFDLLQNDQLLRVLASHTIFYPAISFAYLKYLSQRKIILSIDSMWHFNSIVRSSNCWDVSNTRILADRNCSICQKKFDENPDFSEAEFKLLKNEIMQVLYYFLDLR